MRLNRGRAVHPLFLGLAEENATQTSETMMPALPSESRNLRPLWSTSTTPTMVIRKFTAVRMT